MFKKTISSVAVAAMLLGASGTMMSLSAASPAAPAPKGSFLNYIQVNPYGNAPLTALVDLGGKKIKDVKVTVKGKPNGGIDISYPVGAQTLISHDGIPIVGMYENYRNTVEVSFTDRLTGKKYTETHKILTPPIASTQTDYRTVTTKNRIEVKKVHPKFKNKLFMNNASDGIAEGNNIAWSGIDNAATSFSFGSVPPSAGAMIFEGWPVLYMTDTQGEYRWWLNAEMIAEKNTVDVEKKGEFMGVKETAKGTYTFVFGQMWGEFDLTGKLLYKHRLPRGYIDLSHESVEMPNGNILLRAAKANYLRPDGKIVHTVRDHILELDRTGAMVNVWDLNESLDPYRDVLLKGLDQGAVCLNVDVSKQGQTASDFEPDTAPYGDIAGIGTGRNWAHVNSIDYDPSDDSIIISPRHQATAVKLTRDNKVKWILAPRAGWKPELAKKLLTPVDKNGKKIKCDDMGVCEDTNFDFSWTQHTAWLSPKGTLTVFDNGDGRGNTQPAIAQDKYSRYVEYKIDEKNMTVQQVWEYGKERGYSWYSPIVSNTEIIHEEGFDPYWYGFGGSAELFVNEPTKGIHNIIDYKTKEVMVEIVNHSNRAFEAHYRGILTEPTRWFAK